VHRDFLAGFAYLFRGFRLIREPGLQRYVWVPLLINITVFGVMIWFGATQFSYLVHSLLPEGDQWWAGAIMLFAWIFYGAFAAVLVFFSFAVVANVIASPFNDFLAEKVERRLTFDTHSPGPRASHLLADFLPSIFGEIRHLLYYLLIIVPLLVVSIIPGAPVITGPLIFVFSAWMLALEYLSYPMGNHNRHFPEVRRWLRTHRSLGFGFGLAATIATMVPVVNFFVMPAAVAGATALWVERGEEDPRTESHD
jgi:CysZ protein